MIITPEHLIKKYFPQPVESTQDLYDRLNLHESGYSYLAWLKDAEEYCLTKYFTEEDYKTIPGDEKNYWISPRVFRTLLEASPSMIGDEIRACVSDISNRIAADRTFARQLQDQIDQESGISPLVPKVSKSLKAKYNETGQDAFEYSIQADGRLYLDIISGFNFKPSQKIRDLFFSFRLEVEDNVPFHLIEIMLNLTDDDVLSYRSVWSCQDEAQKYGAILINRIIRVNLFEDNRKLVDSFDYIFVSTDLIALDAELQKVIAMQAELGDEKADINELGERILRRHNLNGQAYALAIKKTIPQMLKHEKLGTNLENAFTDAITCYWEYYVMENDPSREITEDMDLMVKARLPRVELAMIAANILLNSKLCNKFIHRDYSNRQRQALFKDTAPRLIYTLEEAEFDAGIPAEQRMDHICSFIADQFDMMKDILAESRQWPK